MVQNIFFQVETFRDFIIISFTETFIIAVIQGTTADQDKPPTT